MEPQEASKRSSNCITKIPNRWKNTLSFCPSNSQSLKAQAHAGNITLPTCNQLNYTLCLTDASETPENTWPSTVSITSSMLRKIISCRRIGLNCTIVTERGPHSFWTLSRHSIRYNTGSGLYHASHNMWQRYWVMLTHRFLAIVQFNWSSKLWFLFTQECVALFTSAIIYFRSDVELKNQFALFDEKKNPGSQMRSVLS